ncbi:copper homeostasis periplasmic binding protein CopC [Novosphingobium pentaromativorans]|uniref:Copper resistance protein CopC n=1 Tax=Novosphingobium pentaromativorans US6-1 TaxID=1088721 RepID=G6EFY9_9SPHN|nr:copper homeostasis periplasmic binding protein CopC [Novosphingobium pentaromativorans]AIT82312.1 copper resistance protein CopC [Novosphingobium pentaromativorans US6-1]EHJ59678.1 copper resistance protein CopC [Novosphingobium pentaromativorans US6-1]
MPRLTVTSALASLAALALVVPGVAMAHPKLVSSTPAADASVAKPTEITLNFNETLVGPLSGIELVMTGMPGMANHKPMPISGFTTKAEGKSIKVKLPRALPAGSYTLNWHAVAADQHRIEGSYSFTVR